MNTTAGTRATYTAHSSWQTAYQAVYQHTAVGAVAELNANETRVVLTPSMVTELTKNGHTVYVQAGLGNRAGYGDEQYTQQGAHICNNAEEVYKKCSIIVKVNAPEPQEYNLIQAQQVIFCFTCSGNQQQQQQQEQQQEQQQQQQFIKAMNDRHATVISYNNLTRAFGAAAQAAAAAAGQPTATCSGFPVHSAVSELTGYLGVQQAMTLTQQTTGCTFGSAAGAAGNTVLVLGATPCGVRAATVAAAMGARVTLMDTDTEALQHLSLFNPAITTLKYTEQNLEMMLPRVNTLLGCIIPATGQAPLLVNEQQMKMLQQGCVAIDLAAQYGGNFSTTRSGTGSSGSGSNSSGSGNTTNWNGICLYTAANITRLAPRTASCVISQAALSYLLQVANKGWKKAVIECVGLQNGVCIAEGLVTDNTLATTTHTKYTAMESVLEQEINQIANSQQQQQQANVNNLKQQLNTFRIQQSPFTIEA